MAKYIYEFRECVLNLGDNAPTDSDQLHLFVMGLKPHIRMHLLLHRPQLMADAEAMAE